MPIIRSNGKKPVILKSQLPAADRAHNQIIVVAHSETIRLMQKFNVAIKASH